MELNDKQFYECSVNGTHFTGRYLSNLLSEPSRTVSFVVSFVARGTWQIHAPAGPSSRTEPNEEN